MVDYKSIYNKVCPITLDHGGGDRGPPLGLHMTPAGDFKAYLLSFLSDIVSTALTGGDYYASDLGENSH